MNNPNTMLSKSSRKPRIPKHSHYFLSFVCISSLLAYYFLLSPFQAGNHNANHSIECPLSRSSPLIEVSDFNRISEFKLQPIPVSKNISRNDFNKWLEEQTEISFYHMFENICHAETSDKFDNCTPGVVFASPSKNKPDYFYHWIRDGAITINTLINTYLDIDRERTLETVLHYVNASLDLQHKSNPSGPADDPLFRNLGEPKYHVDNSAYELVWGRPQNDGPPLRAIALLNFLNQVDDGETEKYNWIFDEVIALDLKFVLYNWHIPTYDLWEEVRAYHFFTSMVQLKALVEGKRYLLTSEAKGVKLSKQLTILLKDIETCIDKIEDFIIDANSGFINHEKGYIVETPSILDERSGLDIAVIMASTLTHDDSIKDMNTVYDSFLFDIDDPFILNHFNELIERMAVLYPINHNRLNTNMGVAIGRYPEDIYDGIDISEGNPWFISTLTSAELIYKLVNKMYHDEKPLLIDPISNKFWTKFFEFGNMKDSLILIPYNTLAFNQTLYTIFKYGDSFLSKVNEHVSNDGSMSEQFNKYHGYNQGAPNLTWSYGTFSNALRWREIVDRFIHPIAI